MFRLKDLRNVSESNEDFSENPLASKIKSIILEYYELDDRGNPTVPIQDDVGQIEPYEFADEIIDRVWKLVKYS